MARNLEALRVTRTLAEVAAGITRATTSREAMRRLVSAVAPMGFDLVAIGTLDPERTTLCLLTRGPGTDDRWHDVPLVGGTGDPFADVLRTGETIELPRGDRLAFDRYPGLLPGRPAVRDRAWRFVPFAWAGIVHGVIAVAAPDTGDFEESDRLVVDILASEAARVLERCAGFPGIGQWIWNTVTGDIEWSDTKRALHGVALDGPAPTHDEFLALVHPDDLPGFVEAFRDAAARHEAYDVEARGRAADGSWRWMRCRGRPVRGSDGVVRWHGSDEDITDRKAAERERRELQDRMQQAQKLESLGTLAGGIAHDFNNLLVGVLGNVSLVRRELPAGSTAQPMLEDIERGAQRAAELTRQLLAYAGRGRFVLKVLDIAEVVLEMRALLGTAISKRARLQVEAEPGEAWVETDPTQLRQVVMNLLTNASDALEGGDGLVTVRTGIRFCDRACLEGTHAGGQLPEGRYVFVEVADTGRGIDEALVPRIFEPFYSTKAAGHGLGLAATLGIVRAHKGTIQVDTAPGRGSTFRVLLPLGPRPGRVTPPKAAHNHAEWRPGGVVLVVDDEPAVRQVVRRALERAGFTGEEAADGAAAVNRFAELRGCTAVLLDLTMPEMSGDDVLRAIRAQAPGQPVVLMSGYNEQDVTSRMLGRGHAGFLQKPFTVAELLGAVRAAVEPD
ncbi:MAG: response regulator [Gemmatimonadota bacterium]